MIVITIFVMLAMVFFYFEFWTIHVDMNKGEKLPYDFVTFNTFIREFEKYKNDPDLQKYQYDGKSIFLQKNGKFIVYLHADIVKFNDKCMIFYPLDYAIYCLWKKNFNKPPKDNYRVKGMWS